MAMARRVAAGVTEGGGGEEELALPAAMQWTRPGRRDSIVEGTERRAEARTEGWSSWFRPTSVPSMAMIWRTRVISALIERLIAPAKVRASAQTSELP